MSNSVNSNLTCKKMCEKNCACYKFSQFHEIFANGLNRPNLLKRGFVVMVFKLRIIFTKLMKVVLECSLCFFFLEFVAFSDCKMRQTALIYLSSPSKTKCLSFDKYFFKTPLERNSNEINLKI